VLIGGRVEKRERGGQTASFEGSVMTEGKKGGWGDICSGRQSENDWPEGLVWHSHLRLLHPGVDPVIIGPARLRRRVLKNIGFSYLCSVLGILPMRILNYVQPLK
jgi:hypothetical protein